MVKRSSKKKQFNEIHRAATLLGHEGGKKGGPARAEVLSSAKRSDIAREGGKAKARKA